MSSPYSSVVKKLYKAGYSTIPLVAKDKRACFKDWSAYCSKKMKKDEIRKYIKKPDLNIGLTLGPASGVVALDFDDDVDGLHAKILDMIPESPVTKKGARGFTAFYRYNGEKNRSWKVKRDGEKKTVIELLSEGRQTVMPPSVHPDGDIYVYTSMDELSDVSAEDLPELPERFSRELDAIFGFDKDEESELSLTLTEIEKAIEFIPSDDYEDWTHVGMAIKTQYPNDDGYQVWDKWSQSSDKYDPANMKSKWKSFNGSGIGVGTIMYLAFQNGYESDEIKAKLKKDTLRGFITLDQVEDELDNWRFKGRDYGSKSGIPLMDDHLKFRKGEFTILSGYGNAGKSEFLDSILTGLMKGTEDWRFAVSSMEKLPHKHFDDLVHKYVGKPRGDMSVEEYRNAKSFLRDRVVMVDYNKAKRSLAMIFKNVRKYMEFGKLDGVVIDPFNFLKTKYKNTNMLAHVNAVATACSDLAKELDIHVFLVAHPTKPDTTFGKLPRMTKYSIAGGADWVNIADNIVIVSRNQDNTTGILVDKVRDQEVDKLGGFVLQYDKYTRGYTEVKSILDDEDF